jgi:hypothetical protein
MNIETSNGIVGIVCILLATSVVAATKVPERAEQPYRFVLKTEGSRPVEFRGVITVDGTSRVIHHERTPFEFRCEAGSTISGYFEVIGGDGRFRLRVFDPGYSNRRAAAVAKGARVIRFAWARPGVGPRCLDYGSGACPDTVPGVSEMKELLSENE